MKLSGETVTVELKNGTAVQGAILGAIGRTRTRARAVRGRPMLAAALSPPHSPRAAARSAAQAATLT